MSEQDPQVLRDRREKLRRLREAGITPYAKTFADRISVAAARRLAEQETIPSDAVRIAGRLVARRGMGGMAFADVADWSGRIQIVVQSDVVSLDERDRFAMLDLGDIIGVVGEPFRTRRGEPSVRAHHVELLTKSLRPLPEKWHGLKDVETRYRQRYLDLIANDESRDVFLRRTRIISAIRALLDGRGFIEVETPVLQEIPGGGHAKPFVTHYNSLDRDFYLRIALELHLKRLVVGGFERVYELGRLFRNEGLSPRHNPEFTMLEAYQAYATYEDMMELVEALVVASAEAAGAPLQLTVQGEEIDLTPPFRRERMVDLVLEHTGRQLAGIELNEVFEEVVQPALRQPTFVLDYPVEVSPLARRRDDDPRFVERFELMVRGIEYANAFTELTDPIDQRQRFEEQAAAKAAGDEEAHPFDEDYVRALEVGLPPTGGLGLGVDRLVMLLLDQPAIRDVILFPQLRSEG